MVQTHRGNKRPTARDVARHAEVSIGTVSRVLNNVPHVRPAYRERVLAAIEELGFIPDGIAQGLRSRTSRAVACVVTNISLPLFSQHVSGAEAVLYRRGYSLVLMNTHDSASRESEELLLLQRRRLDGLIISVTREDDKETLSTIKNMNIPAVLLERDVPDFDCVLADHRDGTKKAGEYLLALGHRKIALITVTTSNWPGRERKIGLELAYRQAGVPVPADLMCFHGASEEYGYRTAYQILSKPDKPSAIIVGANQVIGVIRAIRLVGLRIPEDISLICIGDTNFAEVFDPPITVIRWNVSSLGEIAAEILLRRLGGENDTAERERIILPTELVLRGSCAPPSK